jgi:hypothetical protein
MHKAKSGIRESKGRESSPRRGRVCGIPSFRWEDSQRGKKAFAGAGSNPPLVLLSAALLFLVVMLAAGCGGDGGGNTGDGWAGAPEARDLKPRTLAHGMISQYGRGDEHLTGEETRPECEVITTAEELDMLLRVAQFQEDLPPVDLSREVVLAVLQGPKNTGGYAVSISRVTQEGFLVEVQVEVVEPEPGSITIQILTSPYHLVALDREAFNPHGQLRFVFLDEKGNLLEEVLAEV